MVQWHRFVQPVVQDNARSALALCDGVLTVLCGGEGDVLVGITGDAARVNIHLNGESHQYERALVQRVTVTGAGGNHNIELEGEEFDMMVVAHGERNDEPPRDEGPDLHACRAQRRRRADDFGLV